MTHSALSFISFIFLLYNKWLTAGSVFTKSMLSQHINDCDFTMSFIEIYHHCKVGKVKVSYRACLVQQYSVFPLPVLAKLKWCVYVCAWVCTHIHTQLHMCLCLQLLVCVHAHHSAGQTWRIASQPEKRAVLASKLAFNCFATGNTFPRKQGAHCECVFISTHLIFSADHWPPPALLHLQ